MPAPTSQEQYLLELINEARLDPLRNAERYITSYTPLISTDADIQKAINFFRVSGSALLAAYQSLNAVAPLSWNNNLSSAAQSHNAEMIAADQQSHQIPGEDSLGTRISNAGYVGWTSLSENVYSFAESMIYGHAGFMIDWGNGPNGMQSPPGHRNTIMSGNFREVGIAVTAENSSATNVGPYVITQDFGTRGLLFVLGVAYSDNDQDDFYSIGEGRGDLTVELAASSTSSAASGGYSLAITPGLHTITMSGGGLFADVLVTTNISSNIKLDVVDGNTLLTSGSVEVSGPVSIIRAINAGTSGVTITAGTGNQQIFGNSGNDTLKGGHGDDVFSGGAGNDAINGDSGTDIAVYEGEHNDYTVSSLSTGNFTVSGPGIGTDTLTSIELLRFADGEYAWNAGSGHLVAANLNEPPTVAASQSVSTNEDTALRVTVISRDPDGDTLNFVSSRSSYGTVSGGTGGVFTYMPDPGYLGSDSFTVTIFDGNGGIASHLVSVSVVEIPAANKLRLVTGDGFVGEIGGSGQVFGTTDFQDITVLDKAGTIAFDPSFNRGGDIVRLSGDAADWQVVQSGSNTIFSDGDTFVPLPIGSTGMSIVFDDGVRLLRFDPDAGIVKIGAQGFGAELVKVTAPADGTQLPAGADAEASAQLIFGEGASASAGGHLIVFGTAEAEQLAFTGGKVTLDPSFNSGGDTLVLHEQAPNFLASRTGSNLFLEGTASDLLIPVGTAGMTLSFAGDDRTLLFDTLLNSIVIGTQEFYTTPTALVAFG